MPPSRHASSVWATDVIVRHAVRALVPATSANLGPAFDCAGLALGLHDELVAMASDDPHVLIEVSGEGEDTVSRDASHLVAVAMARAFDVLGERPTGFVLRCANAIPHGRGLGSSSAAIIGGLALARALVVDGASRMDDHELLQLALTLESHPDNLAATLHGGFTIAWLDAAGQAHAVRRDAHPDIEAVAIIPESRLLTSKARGALPPAVPLADAAFNAGRSALLVHAMTLEPALLFEATEDRLHQEQRRAVYPASMAVVDDLRGAGVPAAISGAGPTVLAFASLQEATAHVPAGWRALALPVVGQGVQIQPV